MNLAANIVPEELFNDDDDDDDMLLLAASQADDELEQQASQNLAGSSSASTSSIWEQNRRDGSGGKERLPVGVVQPLRTITNSRGEPSHKQQQNKKMIAQSSITSFMTSKPQPKVEEPSSNPTFSLLDSDDDLLVDFQCEEEDIKPREVSVSCEPFQYLVDFNQQGQLGLQKARVVHALKLSN